MTGMGDLDPELAELMAMEEAERAAAGESQRGGSADLDADLAELMALMEAEQQAAAVRPPRTGPADLDPELAGLDPELAELMAMEEAQRGDQGQPSSAGVAGERDRRLRQLADLRDRGVLSEAEFEAEKARILGEWDGR